MTTMIERGPDPRFYDGRGSGCSLLDRLTVSRIVQLVASANHVRPTEIVSARRTASIAWPRHSVAWLARHSLPMSLPQIGRALGGRDHTTIQSAIRRVEKRRDTDPVFRVRRQNIWHNSRRKLAECGPRLGVDVRRRACGV
ncbi:MAG: hypothetical protein DI568_17425, partial [Sphingomonas sp.]